MITFCKFIECCCECDCINVILALIFGISICASVGMVVHFLKWKIKREQKFDRSIFETFGRMTCQVGGNRRNNAQGATPGNGNAQNSGGQKGNNRI